MTQLLERLPDDYFLVDVVLRAGNVDHIVTGPCGIVVIETKRVAGRIRCDGDHWTVNGRRSKRSYSKQAKAGAMAVKAFLAARHSDLEREFVQAVVVFTESHCELEVGRSQVAVIRFSQLLAHVVALGQIRRMDPALAAIAARSLAGSVR